MKAGVTIIRPPRDGRAMAFIRTPDNISIELLQKGEFMAGGTVEIDAEYRRLGNVRDVALRNVAKCQPSRSGLCAASRRRHHVRNVPIRRRCAIWAGRGEEDDTMLVRDHRELVLQRPCRRSGCRIDRLAPLRVVRERPRPAARRMDADAVRRFQRCTVCRSRQAAALPARPARFCTGSRLIVEPVLSAPRTTARPA